MVWITVMIMLSVQIPRVGTTVLVTLVTRATVLTVQISTNVWRELTNVMNRTGSQIFSTKVNLVQKNFGAY